MIELKERIIRATTQAQALWGKEFHMRLGQEECAEFIAAVNHFDRGRCSIDKVAEEVADALLALGAARIICGEELVDSFVLQKLERLERRIAEDSEKHDEILRGLR